LFKKQRIPAPEFIAYQENPPTIGSPTVILSAVEGVNLKEANLPKGQENNIYESVGNILRKINETEIEGFGPLKKVNGVFKGEHATYEEYCKRRREGFDKVVDFLVKNNLITSEEAGKLNKILEELDSLGLTQSHLLHRHMHDVHIYVDKGEISGIIDLARLAAGDPRDDIALSLVFQKERQQEHFKKGYGEMANDPVVLKYLAIAAAKKTMYRFQRAGGKNVGKILETLKDTLAGYTL
jgi:aminoglycoside phosphotransferase (APT) family kinase protein